jgi:hypothetical protein
MTPEQIAFRGIVIGGAITLAGTLLASLVQILLQWLQQKWSIASEKSKMFAEKRLNALQGAVQLCDFLDAVRPLTYVSEAVQADWTRIRRENAANGALLPTSIRHEFRTVLNQMVFEVSDPDRPTNALPVIPTTETLRTLCLEAIQNEYDNA